MTETAEPMDVTLYGGPLDGTMLDGVPEDRNVILKRSGDRMHAYECTGRTTRRRGGRRVIFRYLGEMGVLGIALIRIQPKGEKTKHEDD